MITLTFYRFACNTNTHKYIKVVELTRLDFNIVEDHEEKSATFDLLQAKEIAHTWLHNHYGYVLIHYQDENSHLHTIKISNKRNFYFNMLAKKILVRWL